MGDSVRESFGILRAIGRDVLVLPRIGGEVEELPGRVEAIALVASADAPGPVVEQHALGQFGV